MSWIDDTTLPYTTVVGKFGQVLGDGPDSNLSSDLTGLNGSVTLTPSIKYTKINDALVEIKPIEAKLVNGTLMNDRGTEDLHVLPTNTAIASVQGWHWKAKFTLRGARIPLISFYAPEGGTVDLVTEARGISGAAVEYVEGPTGPAGPAGASVTGGESVGYGQMVLNMSDGSKSGVIALPPGPKGDTGLTGPSGKSMYDIAKDLGYSGTKSGWYDTQTSMKSSVVVSDDGRGGLYIDGSAVTLDDRGGIVLYDGISPPPGVWSTNPLAARQGRYISSLYYDTATNRIYSGYGDWTANGDEIGIVSHDLSTGTARIEYFPEKGKSTIRPEFGRAGLYTEAIEKFYRDPIDGVMYVPHTDGAGFWDGCGYASDEGGVWKEHTLSGQAIHVFDVARTSQGLWMCGSSITPDQKYAGAALWFRPSGGEWYMAYQESINPNDYDDNARYYSITVIEDRAWVCTSHTYGSTPAQVRGFKFVPKGDGMRWDNPLPVSALDMQTRNYEPSDVKMASYTVFNSIVVGNFKYTGQQNGQIKKEVLR